LKDKSIELIKWQKAGLENLIVSTCLKRRIRGKAIKDYRIAEHKNLPSIFKVAPMNLQLWMVLNSKITCRKVE